MNLLKLHSKLSLGLINVYKIPPYIARSIKIRSVRVVVDKVNKTIYYYFTLSRRIDKPEARIINVWLRDILIDFPNKPIPILI